MPIEAADFVGELDQNNPFNGDPALQGAEQIRLVKKTLVQSLPNINDEVTCSPDDLNQLTGLTLSELSPTGLISMWAVASTPDGWLQCDGSAILPEFIELIALIGANTPDLRDVFIRGSGDVRAPLSVQAENVGAHDHNYIALTPTGPPGASTDALFAFNNFQQLTTSSNPTGENRPANTALTFIIKT